MKKRNTLVMIGLAMATILCGCRDAAKYDCYVQNLSRDYSLTIAGDRNVLSQLHLGAANSIFALKNDSSLKVTTPVAFKDLAEGGIVVPLKKDTTLYLGKFSQADLSQIRLSFVAGGGAAYGPVTFKFADSNTLYTKPNDYP